MKINISKLTPSEFLFSVNVVEENSGLSDNDLFKMDWSTFMGCHEKMLDRLNMIMPECHQKGLTFKYTTGVGELFVNDKRRSTWITVTRGSKHWFITGIEVDRPAFTSIHPVNMMNDDSTETEKRLWSIIEKVTQPNWFNS